MLAKKDNKVYDIDKSQQSAFTKQGFDIYDENGKLVEYAETKTIKYQKYAEIVAEKDAEINELKEQLVSKDAEVADLKEKFAPKSSDKKDKK